MWNPFAYRTPSRSARWSGRQRISAEMAAAAPSAAAWCSAVRPTQRSVAHGSAPCRGFETRCVGGQEGYGRSWLKTAQLREFVIVPPWAIQEAANSMNVHLQARGVAARST